MISGSDYEDFSQEELFPEGRRESRLERKIASRTDRSKFKKTDQEKSKKQQQLAKQKEQVQEDLLCGRVLSITGLESTVDCEGVLYQCVIRGKFKKDRARVKNFVAVGDFVYFLETAKSEGVIVSVRNRETVLCRADNTTRRKKQLLAANVDQVLIVVSVVKPILKPFLVDRYIIATLKGGIKPVILVNKVDLLSSTDCDPVALEVESKICEEMEEAYKAVGIPFILLSAKEGKGLDALQEVMKDKASVFSGQSGVGKSSLINQVTGLELKTGEVVERTKKGAHTTTATQLIPLEFGGWCVDTPGIGSFGVWDLEKSEIEDYFSEIQQMGQHCQFSNCYHCEEPNCAVRQAVEDGELSSLRYESYLALMKSVEEEFRSR